MWVIEIIREVLKNKKRDREIMVLLERRMEDLKKHECKTMTSDELDICMNKWRRGR